MRPGISSRFAVMSCALLLSTVASAQREEADVEWQKRHAKIEYGVVPVGRHKLDELEIGKTWRMGRNEASVLKTDMPLIAGEQVVVPGQYRVNVARQAEKDFALAIDGGTVGESPEGSPAAVQAKAESQKPEKPTKALEISFKAGAKSSTPVQPAKVTVTYGENQIVAALTLVGIKALKSQGWTLDGFSVPAEIVEKRVTDNKLVPVAAFKKESGDKKNPFRIWNLVVSKDRAELWPAPTAPTDSFGFGEVKSLDSAAMVKATSVKWEDAKDTKPFLEVTKFEVAKGKGATIVFTAGKQTCTIEIPEPKVPG